MATTLSLTAAPILRASVDRQALYLATDVSAYDILDLEVVCFVEGTASGMGFYLVTHMDVDSEDGVFTYAFPAVSGTGPQSTTMSLTGGFFRYIRWDLGGLGGATEVTFTMKALARTFKGIA